MTSYDHHRGDQFYGAVRDEFAEALDQLHKIDFVVPDSHSMQGGHCPPPTPEDNGKWYNPNHYARHKVEPIHFIMENALPFAEGNVVKYISRHDAKDKASDVFKAINYAIMILERAYGIKAHLEID